MYLKQGYFAEKGPHPADDIGQGYLTSTNPAEDIAPEILEIAETDPEFLEQFKPDPLLIEELAKEPGFETFRLYRNDEMSFDGVFDTGYRGYGLDVAFSEQRGFALVAYAGPGLPTVVRRYACASAEEAAGLWQDDWAAPLLVAAHPDNDNIPADVDRTFR